MREGGTPDFGISKDERRGPNRILYERFAMPNPVRLSESRVWKDLREFYESMGVGAWSDDRIPFFATNNPALARTYVDIFCAFLDDLERNGHLNREEPVYMVELGGGMGRLTYLILVRLKEIRERLPVEVRYLLTDYTQTNIDYYSAHECFAQFREGGLLKTLRYDAEKDLLEGIGGNPIFCMANYLFDSLSHDGFRVNKGELSEILCSADGSGKMRYEYRPVQAPPYGIKEYDEVLEGYRRRLGDTHVPFPIGPIRCLERLAEASNNRMLLIMADKALRTDEDLLDFESLPLQKHEGGISMSVNCNALDRVWEAEGGCVVHSAPRANHLHVALYFKGYDTHAAQRTVQTFVDQIDGFGPLDYLDFRAHIIANTNHRSLPLYLQLLRLSRWDPELFYELSNDIGECALSASLEEQHELYTVMSLCWNNYFPIPDERDVPFAMARVLACINQFQQAIGFYGESIRLYGARPLTHHNVGICYFNLGMLDQAEQSFQEALSLDSDYGPSKDLIIRTQAERKRLGELRL